MRILLDENMPESVRVALRQLGHEVNSVISLRLRGLENSRLYREVTHAYDLCFTRDQGFVSSVRAVDRPASVKVIRVTLTQAAGGQFTREFVEAFQRTNWADYPNGSDWPTDR